MDFLGNQPQSSPTVVAPSTGVPTVSEGSYFTSPTFRIRHAALKLATPIVDILAGQYWSLFGWQSMFHPNTVEIQGVPGQIYARTPQIRLSHLFDAGLRGGGGCRRRRPAGTARFRNSRRSGWLALHTQRLEGFAHGGRHRYRRRSAFDRSFRNRSPIQSARLL